MNSIIRKLSASNEPTVVAKLHKYVLDADFETNAKLAQKVKKSKRIMELISVTGHENYNAGHPYQKFDGMHWILSILADCEYPSGDIIIKPYVRSVSDYWLNPDRIKEHNVLKEAPRYKSRAGVPIIDGRARRCASQEGNILYSAVKLGFCDDNCDKLAQLLIRWQWPDGGWNCDRKYEACNSSFMETLIPMRGLYLYGKVTNIKDALEAANRAAEVFLKRHMYKRLSNGEVIKEDFIKLHYPCYWHYDILFGLKVMCEMELIRNNRCSDALDLLESKRLSDGGFPAERKYYKFSDTLMSGCSIVDWGGTSKKKYNEFVTVDTLGVLKAAGRKL